MPLPQLAKAAHLISIGTLSAIHASAALLDSYSTLPQLLASVLQVTITIPLLATASTALLLALGTPQLVPASAQPHLHTLTQVHTHVPLVLQTFPSGTVSPALHVLHIRLSTLSALVARHVLPDLCWTPPPTIALYDTRDIHTNRFLIILSSILLYFIHHTIDTKM